MKNNAFKQSRFSKFMKIMYFVSLLIALLGCVTIFIVSNNGQSFSPNNMTQLNNYSSTTVTATSTAPVTILSPTTAISARSVRPPSSARPTRLNSAAIIPITTSKPTTTNAPLKEASVAKGFDETNCSFLKNINESISITNDRRLTHFPNIQEVVDNFKHLVYICKWKNEHDSDEIKKAICILINKIEQLKKLDNVCIWDRNGRQERLNEYMDEVLICKKNLDYIAHIKLTDQLEYLVRHNYIDLVEIIVNMIKELDFGILTCLEVVDITNPTTLGDLIYYNQRDDPPINQTIHKYLERLQDEQRRRQRGKRSLQNRNFMLQRRMRKTTDSTDIK